MWQFLLKIWSTILEMWQLSKESRLVAEITIFLLIVLWSLHLSDSILKLPTILLIISNMTAVLTPWLILIAGVLMHYFANRDKKASLIPPPWKLHEKVTLGLGDYYGRRIRGQATIESDLVSEIWKIEEVEVP